MSVGVFQEDLYPVIADRTIRHTNTKFEQLTLCTTCPFVESIVERRREVEAREEVKVLRKLPCHRVKRYKLNAVRALAIFVTVIETNLDDINAEHLGHFVETALKAGALDVFYTPIQMKKNRPGVLLTVLCSVDDADRFSEKILRETSALGVRLHNAQRRKLQREQQTVDTPLGQVEVKLGRLNGEIVQASPEYESCREVAEKNNVPLKEVYAAAQKALENGLE